MPNDPEDREDATTGRESEEIMGREEQEFEREDVDDLTFEDEDENPDAS